MLGGGFISLAKDAIAAADEMRGVEARLRMASRSWQEYGQIIDGVRNISRESGVAIAQNAALVGRIAEPIEAMGGSLDDVLSTTRAINSALSISRAGGAEMEAVMAQFSKAMETGVVSSRELNAMMQNTPRLARAIADGLGLTVGELKKLGAQGSLTSQQVLNALKSQEAALADEAARMPQRVGDAWTRLTDGVKEYIAGVDQGLGATDRLSAGLSAVAANIPAIAFGFATLATAVGGGKITAWLAEFIAKNQQMTAASRAAAADAVQRAEAELGLQKAILFRANAESQAIIASRAAAASTETATQAAYVRTAAERLLAANRGVVTAEMALTAAKSAQAAASVGLLGRAMTGAAAAGRGLMGLFGGPLGLAVTAITAGVLAWNHFTDKTKDAAKEAQIPIRDLLKNFEDFSGKAGPNELAEQLLTLRGRAGELRDQLMDPAFRQSDIGKAAAKDLAVLEAAVDRADKRIKKFNDERVGEKAQLGIGKLKLDAGGLVDENLQNSLKAFQTLYADFVKKAAKDNGDLKVSALEARAALDKLFAQAKTPADFSSLIARLNAALKTNPGDSTLQSTLENAIEARAKAEQQALEKLVGGLEARAKRTQGLFTQAANMALAQYNQAYALAKVAAELANDSGAVSRIDSKSRNAEVTMAVQAANLEITALEDIAARKRKLAEEGKAAAQSAADGEIAAAKKRMTDNIAAFEKEAAAGKRTAGQLKDFRIAQEKELAEKIAGPMAAKAQAEMDAARQVQKIDADAARERAAIAETLYNTIKAKAADALSQYKTYASQVIALDKSIANNRLDTMAAIGSLQRTGMTPKEQIKNLKEELDAVRAATAEALGAGQKDQALELLNRQKALVQQIAQTQGEGIDPKKQIQEGVQALSEIGAQADAILQEQRAAAAQSAAEQLKAYQDMVQAMNGLAQQITGLNEKAAVKLKPEIDKESLDGAIAAVQAAFAGVVVPIKVQAEGLPTGQSAPDSTPARAFGGPLPGRAPHDRADNVIYRGTPGEWVIQRPAVRYWGSAFLAAINAMRLPKFADGGQLGQGGLVERLNLPAAPARAADGGASSRTPVVLDFGKLGRYQAEAATDTAQAITAVFRRAALAYGKR